MNNEIGEEDIAIPFVVVGEKYCGKTSLCRKYVYNTFTPENFETWSSKTSIGGFFSLLKSSNNLDFDDIFISSPILFQNRKSGS